MRAKLLLALIMATTVFAEQGRDAGGSGAPPMQAGPLSPFEEFVDKLKLDDKVQAPAAAQAFTDAARDAQAVGTEMMQLRQRLVGAELAGNAADVKAIQDLYTAAAVKMTAIETQAFGKVYATLKPNQQSKAPQAFAVMGGLFIPTSAGNSRGGRRGGER
jgi:hypothetical protein